MVVYIDKKLFILTKSLSYSRYLVFVMSKIAIEMKGDNKYLILSWLQNDLLTNGVSGVEKFKISNHTFLATKSNSYFAFLHVRSRDTIYLISYFYTVTILSIKYTFWSYLVREQNKWKLLSLMLLFLTLITYTTRLLYNFILIIVFLSLHMWL